MQRYWWPGYEMQLLGELQRQQNSTQFCDTLLQTEGISVPTHSCILAALSPYLSQKLSASPSPPSGQKRQLQLQPVKAQTLLKLVGLLYSGEVEVKGSVEQNDVLAVARLFGIRDLVKGHKYGQMEGDLQEKRQLPGSWKENSIQAKENEREENRKMQDAQVQAEMAGRRDTDTPAEKRSCVTTGTQTGEMSVCSCVPFFSQAETPESVSSVAQNVDFPVMLQPQNITLDEQFCSTSCPIIPSVTSGAPKAAQFISDRTSCCVINLKSSSALSNDMMTPSTSLNKNLNSPTPPKDSTCQQSYECGNSLQTLAKKTTGSEDGQTSGHMPDSRENAQEPHWASREEILAEGSGKSTKKRPPHASVGIKNLTKMKQMQRTLETTQISIKVKLRRRTKGEVWEVVSPRDTDETLSVLTSHKKPPCSHCITPNPRDGFGTAPLAPPHGSVEDSDEQIEKLLEDIMMGLNILPNLEKDCKKSHPLQPSHNDVSTICQVPVTQNDAGHCRMQASVSAAGCVFYQDMGTQSGHCSSETGLHCCLTAQNQPDTSLSAVELDTVLIQQQQCPPQCLSSVRFMGHRDEMNCEGMPLYKSQESLHPEALATRSVIAPAFFSAGQKQHDPVLNELSRQDSQHILEYLPSVTSTETQSLCTDSLPCIDDLRIPQCLSPLEPCTSATKHHTVLNQANLGDKVQPQSSLHGRPWLTENSEALQFPLSDITHTKSTSLPQGDTAGDTVAPKKRMRMYTSHPQHAVSLSAYKDLRLGERAKGQISLSVCSVSLSSNNVLAKEREMATSSLTRFIEKSNQPSFFTERLEEQTKEFGADTDQARIRTRGFMKKIHESQSSTSAEKCSVPTSVACRSEIVNNGETFPRRKRGRPRKAKVEELTPPDRYPAVIEISSNSESQEQTDKDLSKEDLEEGDKTKRWCIKKTWSKGTEVEVKSISTESPKAKPDANNNNIIPAVKKIGTAKRPRLTTLKEFQRLIKLRKSKIRKSKETQETNRTERNAAGEEIASADSTCNQSSKEHHSHIYTESAGGEKSEQDNTESSTCMDTSLFGDSPVSPCNVVQEEMPQSAHEREPSLKNPDEEKSFPVPSNTTQETAIKTKGSFHIDTHLPQDNRLPSDDDLCPWTADRTGPHLPDDGGMSRTSVCDHEEEEEVEVDVLLFSPVRAPEIRECEDTLNMEVSPDEEEEDVNEIDVTGDEAE
ncbi:uncharacterized protein LOC113161401 isoform X2 [Anabas testudineus]|uniref:uncharacterized protein LOC113161401 isoform X2 n=1 Tax=Anabas testudineus TaxID=64144 RepID=UPI000E457A17|nr:uncharacterized protein LOC113161401 isoform X2 [Anabas testudineus]